MNALQRSLPVIALFAACSLPPVEDDATSEAVTTARQGIAVELAPLAPPISGHQGPVGGGVGG